MNKVQKGLRLEAWIARAVQKIADDTGATFAYVVNDLLRQELKEMGITFGIGREFSDQDRREAENGDQRMLG